MLVVIVTVSTSGMVLAVVAPTQTYSDDGDPAGPAGNFVGVLCMVEQSCLLLT